MGTRDHPRVIRPWGTPWAFNGGIAVISSLYAGVRYAASARPVPHLVVMLGQGQADHSAVRYASRRSANSFGWPSMGQ